MDRAGFFSCRSRVCSFDAILTGTALQLGCRSCSALCLAPNWWPGRGARKGVGLGLGRRYRRLRGLFLAARRNGCTAILDWFWNADPRFFQIQRFATLGGIRRSDASLSSCASLTYSWCSNIFHSAHAGGLVRSRFIRTARSPCVVAGGSNVFGRCSHFCHETLTAFILSLDDATGN